MDDSVQAGASPDQAGLVLMDCRAPHRAPTGPWRRCRRRFFLLPEAVEGLAEVLLGRAVVRIEECRSCQEARPEVPFAEDRQDSSPCGHQGRLIRIVSQRPHQQRFCL